MLRALKPLTRPCRLRFLLGQISLLFVLLQANARTGFAQNNSRSAVAGRVVHALTGAPIPRVLVQANGHSLFTDHEGRFAVADSSAIESLQVTKPGFALSPEQLDASTVSPAAFADRAALEIELWPEAVLTGTVADPEDQPVPQLTVFAQRRVFQDGTARVQPAGFAVTDSHGNFRIPVPAGEYRVDSRYSPRTTEGNAAFLPAQAPAEGADSGFLSIASGQEVHFALHPQRAVTHRFLVHFDGLPEGQFPALTVRTPQGANFPAQSRIVPEGMALELPAGEYRLLARIFSPDAMRSGEATIQVPDHPASGPAIPLQSLAVVSISIAVEPAEINEAKVASRGSSTPSAYSLALSLERLDGGVAEFGDSVIRPQNRGAMGPSFVATPGRYRFNGGDGGGWILKEASLGGTDLLQSDLVLGPGASGEALHLVVSHRGASLAGVTRLAGRATACWVVLSENAAAHPHVLVRRSDVDGRLTLSDLRPGGYQVLALSLLHSADFSRPEVLERFQTYLQTVTVGASTPTITLEAVPAHELYP